MHQLGGMRGNIQHGDDAEILLAAPVNARDIHAVGFRVGKNFTACQPDSRQRGNRCCDVFFPKYRPIIVHKLRFILLCVERFAHVFPLRGEKRPVQMFII